MEQINFRFEKDIQDLGIRGIFLTIKGMINSRLNQELDILLKESLSNLDSINVEDLRNDEILIGYRKLHEKVNVSNRKFISSPENLLTNFSKNKTYPSINTIVDIYNYISMKYKVALGAHDINNIVGDVTLRFTKGDELFIPLGQESAKEVRNNLYAYVDNSNEVLCLLEVRQVEKTKVVESTTDCFFIIQGNENTSIEYLREVKSELTSLIKEFCGGTETILLELE